MSDVFEVFVATNKTIVRPYTFEESAQREIDFRCQQQAEQERETAEASLIAARQSAMTKLAALGLNESEINAIVGVA